MRLVPSLLRLDCFLPHCMRLDRTEECTPIPVRSVPKNYRSLTGLIPNTRTQSMTAFESSLERDFLLLLDFDPDVEFYEEQPVKITYHDESGRRRIYTPDVLVRYRIDHLQASLTCVRSSTATTSANTGRNTAPSFAPRTATLGSRAGASVS